MNNSRAWIIQICKWPGIEELGLGLSSRRVRWLVVPGGLRGCADGIIYIVTRVRSLNLAPRCARCVSLSPSFLLSYSIYRLLPAPILTAVLLLHIFTLPSPPCLPFMFAYDERRFSFYALVKYFPWFCVLLFVRILLSNFRSRVATMPERRFAVGTLLRFIRMAAVFISPTLQFSILSSVTRFFQHILAFSRSDIRGISELLRCATLSYRSNTSNENIKDWNTRNHIYRVYMFIIILQIFP